MHAKDFFMKKHLIISWAAFLSAGALFTVSCKGPEPEPSVLLIEHETKLSELEASLTTKHTEAVAKLKAEFALERNSLEAEYQQQLIKAREEIEAVYLTFDQVVSNGDDTVSFLKQVRGKLSKEKKLSAQEAAELRVVFLALTKLQESYEAPLSEFALLEGMLADKANAELPEKPKSSFLKWAFSKKHREASSDYKAQSLLKDSYSDTYEQYQTIYKTVQSKIRANAKNLEGTLDQLQAVIDGKSDYSELDQFLGQGMKMIEEHQKMTELEPLPATDAID